MYIRENILDELRTLHGPGEDVEHLIDWIRDAWETRDRLTQQFGAMYAFHVLNAPSPLRHWFSPGAECAQCRKSTSCSRFSQEQKKETPVSSLVGGPQCAIVRYIMRERI